MKSRVYHLPSFSDCVLCETYSLEPFKCDNCIICNKYEPSDARKSTPSWFDEDKIQEIQNWALKGDEVAVIKSAD